MTAYPIGPAQGLSRALYAPDGQPWCRFTRGTTPCVNERQCRNPRHHVDDPAAAFLILMAISGWAGG